MCGPILQRWNAKKVDDQPLKAMCACGEEIEEGSIFMAYPMEDDDDMFMIVCMMCHFWNTHEENYDEPRRGSSPSAD